MIAIFDAHYFENMTTTACVVIDDWKASRPIRAFTNQTHIFGDYVPGEFYKRELPGILVVLGKLDIQPEFIVIDGYVWLEEGRPGLGHRLYASLKETAVVIGLAKNPFKGSPCAIAITRGNSGKPLFVTSDGIPKEMAAQLIMDMAGNHRIPSMIKLADRLSKGHN